jgi:glycerol-3-phosphate dehydrogenase (NAD(P)+)
MLQVLAEELGEAAPTVSLVGPSHAEEVARRFPTVVVAASTQAPAAALAQALFSDEAFRVYTNDDVVGVELAVSLKNVIALAAGISAGLGYGDNTLGALLTRGLAEMTRLGLAMRARPETFFGLAGVGDLITTSVSRHSRNRRVGEAIGSGRTLNDVMTEMDMVAEGVHTARAARDLARGARVDMPIVERVCAVLFEGEDPRAAITALMTREPKAEDPTPSPSRRGSE